MNEPDFCPCARCQAEKASCLERCQLSLKHHERTAPHLIDSLLTDEEKLSLNLEYAKYKDAYSGILANK